MIFLFKQYLVRMLHKSMEVFPRTARRRQFIPTKVYTADMRRAKGLVLNFMKKQTVKLLEFTFLVLQIIIYWNNIQATILVSLT